MNFGSTQFSIFWLILLLCMINLELLVCLKCEFVYSGNNYLCNVIPDSRSTEEHFNGKTDDDVEKIRFNGTIKESTPFCQRFKNVKKIDVFEKKSVDKNLFQKCENLNEARISFTDIKEIPEKLFFELSNLTEIDLSKNKLSTLPEDVFVSQKELEFLYLHQNQISCLPSNVFKSLTNLQQINLIGNKIQDLPKNIFKNLINLKWLYLNNNQLTTIHSDSFGILRKLSKISLSYNRINAIDEKFIKNTAIEWIYMKENVCSNQNIKEKDKLNEKLNNCFKNYQPRQDSSGSVDSCSHEFIQLTEKMTTKTFIQPTMTTTKLVRPTKRTTTMKFFHPTEKTKTTIDCGNRVNFVKGLIYGGTLIDRGEFPWNVALIKSNGDIFCGGTLVSKKHVVTAAHCIIGKNGNHNFGPGDFTVMLGVHNYKRPVELGRIIAKIKSIHVHKHWNANVPNFDGDIAVLELASEVEFNNYIQPICLTDEDTEVAEASSGIVIGFGLTENGTLSDIANKLEISISSYHKCISDSSNHQIFASARTFCGGPADGRGVCLGDSGGGVYVLHNESFYLRGLVSSALVNNKYECDTYKQAVFTDVTQYYGWIDRSVSSSTKARFGEHATTTTYSTTQRTTKTSRIPQLALSTTVSYNFDEPIWN